MSDKVFSALDRSLDILGRAGYDIEKSRADLERARNLLAKAQTVFKQFGQRDCDCPFGDDTELCPLCQLREAIAACERKE